MGYVEPSADFDAAVSELRAGDPRRHAGRRRRSATARASCTRPASCTRAARRPGASCSSSTTRRPTSRSPDADYGFTRLKHAQAIGDLETLRAHDLPAERVTLEGDDPAAGAARADRAPEGAAVSAVAAAPADEPPRRGARAPAGPPDDARHLRRHRRPGQAQAAAGALQPRPRGRAARALQPRRRLALASMPDEEFRDDGAARPSASSRAASPTRPCSTSCSTRSRYVPGHLRRRVGLRRR